MTNNKSKTTTNSSTEDARLTDWRKEHAEQAAKVEDLTTAKMNADARLAEIEVSWQNGEDAATAEDHAIASADVKRTSALLAAAEARLTALENAQPVPLLLAHELSDTLSDLLNEPVVVSRHDAEGVAMLVPSGRVGSSSGVLTGTVTLWRDSRPFSAGMDAEGLQDALRKHGAFGKAEALSRGEREGVKLTVSAYAPGGLPVVPGDPDVAAVRALAESSLAIAEGKLLMRDVPVSLARTDRGAISFEFGVSHKMVTDDDGNAVRVTTVRAMPKLAGGYTSGEDVRRYTNQVLSSAAFALESEDLGRPIPHLGTVTEVWDGGFALSSFTGEVA